MKEAEVVEFSSDLMTSVEKLEQFCNRSYLILGNGKDALFDLMDAVLSTRNISSFVELSLSPVFRREWQAHL
jgi:hypothetical protein